MISWLLGPMINSTVTWLSSSSENITRSDVCKKRRGWLKMRRSDMGSPSGTSHWRTSVCLMTIGVWTLQHQLEVDPNNLTLLVCYLNIEARRDETRFREMSRMCWRASAPSSRLSLRRANRLRGLLTLLIFFTQMQWEGRWSETSTLQITRIIDQWIEQSLIRSRLTLCGRRCCENSKQLLRCSRSRIIRWLMMNSVNSWCRWDTWIDKLWTLICCLIEFGSSWRSVRSCRSMTFLSSWLRFSRLRCQTHSLNTILGREKRSNLCLSKTSKTSLISLMILSPLMLPTIHLITLEMQMLSSACPLHRGSKQRRNSLHLLQIKELTRRTKSNKRKFMKLSKISWTRREQSQRSLRIHFESPWPMNGWASPFTILSLIKEISIRNERLSPRKLRNKLRWKTAHSNLMFHQSLRILPFVIALRKQEWQLDWPKRSSSRSEGLLSRSKRTGHQLPKRKLLTQDAHLDLAFPDRIVFLRRSPQDDRD